MTHLRFTACAAALAAAAVLGACAGGGRVRTDQDPAADLRAYRTFAFQERHSADRLGYTSIMTQRLAYATRQRMESLGYVYDESAPELRVHFYLKVAEKMEIRTAPASFAPAARHRTWAQNVESVNYKEGTLRIDLVDARRRALVWQGVAEGRLDENELRHPGPAVDAAVRDIFAALGTPKAAAASPAP